MQMTVVLFQIDFDRFSALAVNLDQQSQVWKSTFQSRQDLISGLDKAGVVTTEEMQELQDGTWFEKCAPILRMSVDRKEIEDEGFERVLPAMPN